MTDISVFTQTLASDDRSWDLTQPHQGATRNRVIDVSAFNQAQHFPKGFIPSGAVLAIATSGGHNTFLVPYLDAGSAGASTALGILKAPVQIVKPDGSLATKVGCALYVAFADIDTAKLPFTVGNAALGGYIDANAKVDLPRIHFGTV